RPSQNILEMLPEALRPAASGAMHRVRRDMRAARYDGVTLDGRPGRYSLIAETLRTDGGAPPHILLSFTPLTEVVDVTALEQARVEASDSSVATLAPAATLSRDHLHALEDELAYTKESLQSAIEEHETTNEELQATNEELIASNEELQSTNEELHS